MLFVAFIVPEFLHIMYINAIANRGMNMLDFFWIRCTSCSFVAILLLYSCSVVRNIIPAIIFTICRYMALKLTFFPYFFNYLIHYSSATVKYCSTAFQ